MKFIINSFMAADLEKALEIKCGTFYVDSYCIFSFPTSCLKKVNEKKFVLKGGGCY